MKRMTAVTVSSDDYLRTVRCLLERGGAGQQEEKSRAAGLLACTGVAALCVVNSTLIALLGALAWGLGLSVVFPSTMSAAGEVPGRGARAIAVVATIGYGGFLLGAPLIGLLAHAMPLDRALLAVAVLLLPIAVLAPTTRERGAQSSKAKDEVLTE